MLPSASSLCGIPTAAVTELNLSLKGGETREAAGVKDGQRRGRHLTCLKNIEGVYTVHTSAHLPAHHLEGFSPMAGDQDGEAAAVVTVAVGAAEVAFGGVVATGIVVVTAPVEGFVTVAEVAVAVLGAVLVGAGAVVPVGDKRTSWNSSNRVKGSSSSSRISSGSLI